MASINTQEQREEMARYIINAELRRNEVEVSEFTAKLVNGDEIYAFEWQDKAVLAAAKLMAYRLVIKRLDEGRNASAIISEMKVRTQSWLHGAGLGGSTSMGRRTADAAKAEVALRIHGIGPADEVVGALKMLEQYDNTSGQLPKVS